MKVMVVKSTEREMNAVAMNGENRPLVADGPVEFEKQPVEVQGFRKITHHLRGLQRIYVKLIQKNRSMSTCNEFNLETLGSRPIPIPYHCAQTYLKSGICYATTSLLLMLF
jgi:hypothetical protein